MKLMKSIPFTLLAIASVIPQAALADSYRFYSNPITAEQVWPSLSPVADDLIKYSNERDSILGKVSTPVLEVCAYYVLSCLDRHQTSTPTYEKAVKSLIAGLNEKGMLDDWDFATLHSNETLLKKRLLETVMGQRYIRFPRISIDDKRNIKLRYPFPEIYSRPDSIVIFNESMDDNKTMHFRHYETVLKESAAAPGEEIVLISNRTRRNDSDFERQDWDGEQLEIEKSIGQSRLTK